MLSQLRVLAKDAGIPPKEDETFVEVQILRDQGSLRFSSDVYQVRVSENLEVSTEVSRVAAAPSVS